ncbi:ABC transporter permease [Limnoglobus roseus]|uniref:ABC transporter permease n=1 Tax=Limnoglobus roseus TaxID=2598579 RepID=A0A5C1AMC0_9BACT|nr:ABC transporter permease [Limnoglobus roseus]QEL20110.1 ABC transporter permease [Limnoglobus roseus]
MGYSLQTLWHEKARYSAGVGAVAFSAVLMALQFGLLLGLFTITSIPLDHTDPRIVWIGSKGVEAIDLGQPIPISYLGRVGEHSGVLPPEPYIANFANFQKPDGGTDLCFLLGHFGNAGIPDMLTSEQRTALTEPFAIVMDESDMKRMGMTAVNQTAKINGKEVRLVGSVKGLKSLAAPWVICSHYTASELMGALLPPDHTKYLLAKCDTPERAADLAAHLKAEYSDMAVYTSGEFSTSTRTYWLLRTKAGIAIGYAALLGLLVGGAVTVQTLYAATIASAKEYATLFALGIPRWRVYVTVLFQAFWIGIFGIALAYPVVQLLAAGARAAGTQVILRWEIMTGTALITMGMSVFAGLFALRSVRGIEPISLLR